MLGRLMCAIGRHAWRPSENPEMGPAPYLACARRGKDKPQYDPPKAGPAGTIPGG
jgi:hypothetical protein